MTAGRRPATASREEGERSDGEVVAGIEFDEDDDPFYADDDYIYNTRYHYWEPRPGWMHPECVDPSAAKGHGTCCKHPEDALVTRALDLADAVDHTLGGFGGDSTGDCAQTARELVRLLESLPALIGEIHAIAPAANRTVAAQLLCPVGRLILLVIELAGRSGCPLACSDHGAPDRRDTIAPLVPMLEACDEALWATVLPRPPPRRRGVSAEPIR